MATVIPQPLGWEPAVYEHKAALIGASPAAVSRSADLLAAAVLAEYRAYGTDSLVVGIDVYTIEAETLGATVAAVADDACPQVVVHPWTLDALPSAPAVPAAERMQRLATLLTAADSVRSQLSVAAASAPAGDSRRQPPRPFIRIPVSGPVSMAGSLVGFEDLAVGLFAGDAAALQLLEFCCAVGLRCIELIRRRGFDAIVFDSSAAPPMLSPALYRDTVQRLHARLMQSLIDSGQDLRPLIVGGDATAIAGDLRATGANVLICDFPADAAAFATALGDQRGLWVRRNVNPQNLATESDQTAVIHELLCDLQQFDRPILGTGILPFGQDPAPVCALRDAVRVVADSERGTAP